jgi:drug/metabolite transporter (DMT)-like permease
MVIAVICSLASAAAFAMASVLQHAAARSAPQAESLRLRLLTDLLQRPQWLAGLAVSALGFFLQAAALAFGPLTLVEPLIVTELAFALPLAARFGHRKMGKREWWGTAAVIAGLALFLVASSPSGSRTSHPSDLAWMRVGIGVTIVVAACLLLASHRNTVWRATLLGVCAGTAFGLLSALVKAVTVLLRTHGVLGTLANWQPYSLALVAPLGELFAQSAYQAGPLAASLPAIDALEPGVAVVIGAAAFGESLNNSPIALSLEVVGVLLIITGIITVDTSPIMVELQRPAETGPSDSGDR